jgi:hypothetical protein
MSSNQSDRANALYESDFYGWTELQANVLANRQVEALDWQNLREEVISLGKQEYRELVSRLTVLVGHLLKWEYQPDKRSRSWFLTIREQRRAIRRHLQGNPSLKSRIPTALSDAFEAGVDLALRDTDLPIRTFPSHCLFTFEDIMADHFLCDTSQDWSSKILGLKPRRSTTALLLNISTFTKYMLKCETWKKPIGFDFTPHQNKSRYCGALWAV